MESQKNSPNILANSLRHKKVFLKSLLFSRTFFRLALDFKSFMRDVADRLFGSKVSLKAATVQSIVVKDPFSSFFKQTLAIGGALFIVMSFATHSPETGYTAEYVGDEIDLIDQEQYAPLPSFIMNDEGFVLKPSSATEDSSRIGFTDSVKHTVVSGENINVIAKLYGLSARTINWENNLNDNATLKVGQTLIIPAIDGVSYTVSAKSETLSSIAKSYGIDAKLISEHNTLTGGTLTKGQKIFIPGGKKKDEYVAIREGTRSGGRAFSGNTFNTKIVMASNNQPVSGKEFIFPANGEVTQGFRAGHYAIDIANSSRPDVWSAAGGAIVTAKGGCPERNEMVDRKCNGGYGNYVVIDHGDGLQTLYSHLQTIYVNEGQTVTRGQAIGKMGSSGRVYGPTGIHLHFEVIDNGVKRNPNNYF